MSDFVDFRIIDTAVFVIANVINLLLTAIFLCRPKGLRKAERVCGLVCVSMVLPLGVAVILNFLGNRELWMILLPLRMILFLVLELLFDYILMWEFRKTRWLWPYLLLYYSALMAMIGYSFLIGKTYGFITLGTYFLGLMATWYSYAKVGHGQ
jgi:hypothetical protein